MKKPQLQQLFLCLAAVGLSVAAPILSSLDKVLLVKWWIVPPLSSSTTSSPGSPSTISTTTEPNPDPCRGETPTGSSTETSENITTLGLGSGSSTGASTDSATGTDTVTATTPRNFADSDYPWLDSGKFEGDIIMAESDDPGSDPQQNALSGSQYRWSNNTIYYRIRDGDFTEQQAAHIQQIWGVFATRSCVQVLQAPDDALDYVLVTGDADGCYSQVGRRGGEQRLNLAPAAVNEGCLHSGTVVHEMLHAAGFFHQQSATDRDDWVTIIWENIQPGMELNFQKYNSSIITSFGVPYDYASVMHYPRDAFSRNGSDTIIPTDPNAQIGQREGFSDRDLEKLRLMYNCSTTN